MHASGSGIKRALPWDPYLRDRRKLFLQQLANHVIHYHPAGNTGYDYDGVLWRFPQLEMINPNLPGGDSGIRELDSLTFNTFSGPQGYTRARLLNAAEDEIETVQNYFPGKLVQFGFLT